MENNLYVNELFKSRVPFWRVWVFFGFCSLAFLAIVARAAYVQVVNSDFYIAKGDQRFTRNVAMMAPRGRVLDRNGFILAESVEARDVTINPRQFLAVTDKLTVQKNQTAVQAERSKIKRLASILQQPYQQVLAKVENKDRSWLLLAPRVSLDKVGAIQALNIPGLQLEKSYRRDYTLGASAAHLVGVTNSDGQGQEGVELVYDRQLHATAGQRRVVRDSVGRVIDEIKEFYVEPVPGEDVQLTIDKSIQAFSYETLKAAVIKNKALSGSLVVLDAKSGEVLALTNYPSYDPSNRKTFKSSNMRNRVLTDMFEPGSTIKPFSVALALEQGVVNAKTKIDTGAGKAKVYGRTISDVSKNGVITVEQVIQKSSNIGVARMVMDLPAQDMWQVYTAAGFGEKPNINFPGVVSGSLRHHSGWRPIEKVTMGYGYGLSASLFQLARAYSVFANDGEVVTTSVLKTADAGAKHRVFSAKTANQMKEMLLLATTSAGAGGLRAQTENYSVAGKSGTAQKQVSGSYSSKRHRAWYAGLSPAVDPKIIVAVMIDEPKADGYYGGKVAAPVFAEIVQQTLRYLRVQPDKMTLTTQVTRNSNNSNNYHRGGA